MNSSAVAARSRKNRSSSARGGRGKGVERQVPADGVYTNHRFMQTVGALVGLPVLIQTKTNEIIEGVFTTFSPNFDLVLDMAHPVSRTDPSIINPETIKRKMIFSATDIVTIKVTNVDLDYATKEGFAVDQVISRFNGQVTERPLEPWQGDGNTEDNLALGEESSNGWDVDDMFRKNEEKYGVTTSYTPEMEGYTTPLNRRNTREYREREAKAQRIAAEIMSAPTTQARSDVENGDEEEKFSAVIRPAEQAASGGGGGATKYVPPMLRKKNQGNSGKLTRSTPPPPSGQGNRYGGSNPTTPTSPSCTGPPQVSSGSHSPIGGPNGPGVTSPGYASQQAPPPTHSPSPTAHPPLHRHNSHSHPSDSKLNGEAKGSSYERRNHDGPGSEPSRENHHNENSNKQDHHGRQHHSDISQQKAQQKPPSSHQHQGGQHTGHMPPVGQGDHRKQEPREQREPRKQRTNKEEQIADLKKFSQDFKLSEQAEKKAQNQQHQPPIQQHLLQPQEPTQQASQQHAQQPQHHQQQPRQQPPPQPQQPMPPPQTQQPPPPPQQQPPPPQPQQPQPPQTQQAPPPQQPPSHMPPQQSQHRQTPPVTTPVPQGPQQNVSQSPHHPQNPPTMTMSSVAEVSKAHEEVDKISSTVSHSKLNPNAKEFVFNPHAKPFSPRSPSTTTPPRPHTPQTPQIPTNQPPQMTGCPVGFQQAMVSAAYVMSQPFAVQQARFPKRGPLGSNQRPEYTSPMQVAAATGQPILAPAPMNTQPQAIATVQNPQILMPQTPQPYQQYPGMPMMVRFPHAGMQMVTAMVPTSMGLYSQAADSQQQSQQHQTMYMAPTSLPPHQPHPAHTPGPQPSQPPTPQNPGGGGPPNMPNQPPTPGPTTPQPLMYTHMGGQPSLPQHLPQHSPHTAQSPHAHQYPGQNATVAAAVTGGHHGGPGQQMATQIVMIPPNMAGPHMMHHSGPPPHSATHIPSSMSGLPPTSSTVPHMPSAHIQYIQGKHPRFPH